VRYLGRQPPNKVDQQNNHCCSKSAYETCWHWEQLRVPMVMHQQPDNTT
jgi:hypothetical protein